MSNPEVRPDELERCIADQAAAVVESKSKADWLELVRLHAMRSPETVERLERERGLR